MERKNLLLSLCALVFGSLFLLELTQRSSRVSVRSVRGRNNGNTNRVLYSNYLWQRDDDDDYFGNTNQTGYFSYNQNYKAQGNNNNLGGGSYVNGNGTSYGNDDAIAGQDDDANRGYSNQAAANGNSNSNGNVSEESTLDWFGRLSPAQSAILGVGIGLLLLGLLGCVMYGPTLWMLFTNWLFNRKTDKASNYQLNDWA